MARAESLIRQWNLLKALQARHFGLSADELARHLDCSKRQVQRDLKVLQDVGFPIYFEDRDLSRRFWRLNAPAFREGQLLLSITEMVSLVLGRQLLAPLAGTQFGDGLGSAISKIKALLPTQALEHFRDLEETLLVKTAARHDYSTQDREIRILNQAIADGRALKVRYRSASKGRELQTEFHPYGLVFFGANLYCIGHLAEYGEVRTLKVDRILSLELTGQTFQRPADFSLRAYLDGSFGVFSPGRLQKVRVRFSDWAATNIREQQWHASQRIVSDRRDHLVAEFCLSDTTEFKRWLLGFGRRAVVLRPRSLAGEIAAELTATRAAYRAG